LQSILTAREKMANGFLMLYSDILVADSVFSQLLTCKEDIVLVVDNAIQYLGPSSDKPRDFVVSRNKKNRLRRNISFHSQNTIAKIGKRLDPGVSTHEFIGLARFSRTGAEQFLETYEDCIRNHIGKIQEAEDISQFRFTDLIQEMIDRGFQIHFLEIHKGWLEIHYPQDIELANDLYMAQKPSNLTV
jgi:phosphoenolpyruvate phosphomutase